MTAPFEVCDCDRLDRHIGDLVAGAVLIAVAVLAGVSGRLGWVTCAAAVAVGTVLLSLAGPPLFWIWRSHRSGRCPQGGRS